MAVTYYDVVEDQDRFSQMLDITQGGRRVPVILQSGKVTIGYGGT